jgi:hypothetical protein
MVLVAVFVAGCGQPLQINTPPAPPATELAGLPTAPPGASPTPSPGDVEATPDLNQPQATPEVPPSAAVTPAAPSSTPAVIVIPQTAVPLTSEQIWRAQELDRQIFDPKRLYIANDNVALMWYDPLSGQSLTIGTIRGEFPVQAQFILRSNRRPALEVPYRINNDFGLTAISEAARARMKAAGYAESVEAYVEQSEAVVRK